MSNSIKFTPGPWEASEAKRSPMCMGQTVVCDTRGQWVAVTHVWGMQDFAEANARLIAAAPELLAALDAMLNTEWAIKPGTRDEWDIRSDVLEDAREAIRKATGGAP